MGDKYKGKDLMLAVEQKDCHKLLDFALKNKSKKSPLSFKGMMSELSEAEIQVMWGELNRGVEERTRQLLLSNNRQLHHDLCLFLQAAIDLGVAYFELERTTTPTCTALLSIVVHLNSTLLHLPSSLEGLKNSIAHLCEKMFHAKPLYQEHVCHNTMHYILRRSLAHRAAKKEVKRVYALRSLLPLLLSFPDVMELVKKCVASSLYTGMLEGQKIVKVALTADVDHVAEIHEAIKQKLTMCSTAQASAYGKIYYHAWVYAVKNDLPELKAELEMTCIQNIILLAIQGRQKQFVANLRKILAQFHSQKKEIYVSKMLYFLYQPILWRYIKNPDGVVRANAAQLFLDVFPLEDPDVKIVTSDQELNDQMLIIKDLLLDDFPIVRSSSVIGLCIAMSVNWELFPEDMLKTYFKIIINDLSCDSSSSDVRLSVAKGLKVLLENPLTLGTMEQILPKVRHLFHDISDGVRIAFCQLLLRVKRIAAIKYWRIVPLEHLLARLEEDTTVSRALVSLLHNSYFPPSESPSCWLHRCVEMVKADRGASRVFFQHVSQHIGLPATAQFMKCSVECVHFYVRSKVCSKRLNVSSSALEEGEAAEEEALGLHDPHVVSGLLDGVAILWLANITHMEKPENKQYLKMVVSKLTKCLGDLSLYYKDTPVWQSVYYLCSFMPSLPSLAPLCFARLLALSPSSPQEDSTTLLECLCAQEPSSLLTLLQEWIEEGLKEEGEKREKPPAPKKRKKSKKQQPEDDKYKEDEKEGGRGVLALRLLKSALERRSCQKALLFTNPHKLKEMLHFMEDIKRRVESVAEEESEFLRSLFMLLLQIAVLLRGENEFSAVKFVEDVLSWLQLKVLRPSPNNLTHKSTSSSNQPLARGMCEDLLSVMADMTLLGFLNMKSLKFLKFGMNLLQLGCGMLRPVCHLLLRHVTYGAHARLQHPDEEGEDMLHIVPDCYSKILHHMGREEFLSTLTQAELKECQSLLSASLHQLQGELLSAATLVLLRALLATHQQQTWDSFEDFTISASGTILLSILCTKHKIIVCFLQQLQKHVGSAEMEARSWVACFAIVHTIQEYKKCSRPVRRELLLLLDKMESALRAPLKSLDTNVQPHRPQPNKETQYPSFEEHYLSQCSQLKDRLMKKAVS